MEDNSICIGKTKNKKNKKPRTASCKSLHCVEAGGKERKKAKPLELNWLRGQA